MNLIEKISSYEICKCEQIAHIYKDSSITYGELIEKSDAIASYIIDQFGDDKTPIVVYGHKEHEMLICFLACVKAGHAYIPIDTSFPYERVRDIVDSSQTNMIFNVGEFDYKFSDVNVKNYNQIKEILLEYKLRKPDKKYLVGKEDTYYIIYTSGSTGKPKGVQITLSCLESFINWAAKVCSLRDNFNYVFMNQAPFSFDLSVMDLYLSLWSGSTLFSIDKSMTSNLKLLFESFSSSNINIWVSTPSFAEMCLGDSSFNEELLPKLETFLFCGETLANSCAERLLDKFSKSKVINMYGPTEATVAVTSIEVTEEVAKEICPLPVGKVKEDCRIIIVDEEGNEVSEGERGEIIIIGDSVSIGYYNNNERTEKSFSKKFINGAEKRCYKTGDEGYLKHGLLYYSGRIDFQIKLNGYRIELEDIENNLRNIEFINNCVVIPAIKEDKIQYLNAVVVLNRSPWEKEFKIAMLIKNELKKFIPDYMIPRKITIVESLPMTINGKVNRKALMEETK
ncbi:D-alanine--poly(phosphoribitol) ligase subunit DltA [Clostridium thailandense]|uniref:D-alanine--poly(phosphoribitol) ligase subunit DltA n=1 Tax=Clostridium thailandense TaxID=2794346 RepID=UPI00398A2C69